MRMNPSRHGNSPHTSREVIFCNLFCKLSSQLCIHPCNPFCLLCIPSCILVWPPCKPFCTSVSCMHRCMLVLYLYKYLCTLPLLWCKIVCMSFYPSCSLAYNLLH